MLTALMLTAFLLALICHYMQAHLNAKTESGLFTILEVASWLYIIAGCVAGLKLMSAT